LPTAHITWKNQKLKIDTFDIHYVCIG